MVVTVNAEPLALWSALEDASGAVGRAVSLTLRPHGLTSAQFELLSLLEEMRCGCCGEGECRCPSSYLCQTDISGRIACTKGNVSGIVQRLVVDGLISREPDPDDRRCNSVRITAEGRRVLLAARPDVARAAGQAFGSLDSSESAVLMRLLRRVAGAR